MIKMNHHIEACSITLTLPYNQFIMQKLLQYKKFTGLDTRCSSQQAFVSIQRHLIKHWSKQQYRIWGSVDLLILYTTRITLSTVAKGFITSDEA